MLSSNSPRGGQDHSASLGGRPEAQPRQWYIVGSLFPALVAAILLAVLAAMGSWWLWPAVIALGLPPLLIVWPQPHEGNGAGWHLRQFHRPR